MASDGRPYRGSVLSSAAARLGAFHALRVASPSRMTTSHRRVEAPFSTEPYRYVLFIRRQGANETTWDFHTSVLSVIVCRRYRQSCTRSWQRYRVSPSRRILSGASAAAGAWPTVITETRQLPQHSHLAPPSPAVARAPGSYRAMRVRVRISEPARTSPGRIGFHKSSFRLKSHRFLD